MITVRTANENDLEEIFRIEKLSFKEPYPKSLLYIYLKLSGDLFLVVEDRGKVIGYIIGLIKHSIIGHIISLAIDPEYRRKGYGSYLLTALLDKLEKLGARIVRLEVRVSNKTAIRLYLKHGFKIAYTLKNFYLDGENAYVMFKILK